MKNSTILGVIVSVLAAALAFLPSLLDAQRSFSPELGLGALSVAILVWTVVFASENLAELRRARQADFQPLLDAELPNQVFFGNDKAVRLTTRNLGKGAATALRCRIWRPEHPDRHNWYSLPVEVPQVLDAQTHFEVDLPITHSDYFHGHVVDHMIPAAPAGSPDLIVEVECFDALGEYHRFRFPYGYYNDTDTQKKLLQRMSIDVIPGRLGTHDRQEAIVKHLQSVCANVAVTIPEWGVVETPRGFNLRFAKGEVHMSRSRSAAEIAETFRNRLVQFTDDDSALDSGDPGPNDLPEQTA